MTQALRAKIDAAQKAINRSHSVADANDAADAAVLDMHTALIAAGWTVRLKGSDQRLNSWTTWTAPKGRDQVELAMGRIKVLSDEQKQVARAQHMDRVERENAR